MKGVVARIIRASVLGRDSIMNPLDQPKYLNMAMKMLFLSSTEEVDNAVRSDKLTNLDPTWSHGLWITRGRLGNSINLVLGVDELPILL